MPLPAKRIRSRPTMPCLAHPHPRRTPSRLRTVLVAALIGSVICSTAQARGIIRDAETEALIRDYAKPIFRAAGVGSQNIRIHIVNDRNFNAFVVDGHNMFMHAGALMIAETPNQVIGVIAHETGHITGGHLARLRSQMARAKSASLMLQLLGLAAVAGGAVQRPNTRNLRPTDATSRCSSLKTSSKPPIDSSSSRPSLSARSASDSPGNWPATTSSSKKDNLLNMATWQI